MSWAYYNEIDSYAAEWLRNLIAAGHIAPGVVDERSIEDVLPDDIREFAQCHFFAGVGVWSHALRRAGWADDRPVWTGSCPCQPFSAAGQGAGFDDPRHLWPHFHWLIQECRPAVVLGEQVASKDADPWVDLVCADVEALGYAFGAVPFPSAGVGAPHIRDRLYWVAHAGAEREQRGGQQRQQPKDGGAAGGLGHAHGIGAGRHGRSVRGTVDRLDGQHGAHDAHASGAACWMANADGPDAAQEHARHDAFNEQRPPLGRGAVEPSGVGTGGRAGARSDCAGRGRIGPAGPLAGLERPGPTNGLWRAADWLLCRDGKWRPVEPGTFPLAHGAPARVGRLRAYGNGLCAPAARVFIEAVAESLT